jgi:DNA-3-methyladenine glycosylase I
VGRGSLPSHLPAARLGVRPRDGDADVAAGVRAGADVPRHRRGRHRPGRGGRIALVRCWETADPAYNDYHDEEWGRPIVDERGLYERLCLEGFQSGLSWLTILRKREAFRAAFEGFDPDRVARFGGRDVERLLADASIVRHRGKIEAAIANARATVALRDGVPLHERFWAHAPERSGEGGADGARALAKELKRLGFRFVGPTTVHSAMQACGVVNDHVADCWVRQAVEAERRAALTT